jgi:AraC-like DNA-binding protein/quercetin dioxygenase-like cupin family protein
MTNGSQKTDTELQAQNSTSLHSAMFIRDPEFRHIEARFSQYAVDAFKKHTHETYAVGVVEQGPTNYFHINTTYVIQSGMTALINPGEVHACNPQPGAVWVYRMLYIDIDLMRDVASELWEAELPLPRLAPPVVEDSSLFQAFSELYTVFAESDDRLEKDTCTHDALTYLLTHYSQQRSPVRSPEPTDIPTQRAYDYLMEHLAENIALQHLASEAGLSAYHLLRSFRERYGLPPHAFQLQQRINVAKRMLAEGISIAETAFELGFADQSHFTKKFKAFVGATPRQYQHSM